MTSYKLAKNNDTFETVRVIILEFVGLSIDEEFA